jgi:hypothetical protein
MPDFRDKRWEVSYWSFVANGTVRRATDEGQVRVSLPQVR